MGANVEGDLNDGKYVLELLKTNSQELGNSGKLNITTTFNALQDFVANYKISVSSVVCFDLFITISCDSST